MSTEIAPLNNAQSDTTEFLAVIERLATNPEVDPEKIDRFLQMKERVDAKRAEMAFNAAFAEMQEELPVIEENGIIKVGEQIRSRYARFEDINDVIKPILKAHGFAIMYKTSSQKGEVTVTGVLTHREGHRETSELTLEADTSGSKNSVQSIGSSTQYGKRYVVNALLNLTSRGQDDDGKRGATQLISESQVADLNALIDEVKADKAKFCQYFKVDKVESIPADSFKRAVAALRKKAA